MARNVPDRANMRQKYWITTGDVGSLDNTKREHNLGSRQGQAAMRRAVDAHAKRTGKTSWAVRDKDFGPRDSVKNSLYTKEVK